MAEINYGNIQNKLAQLSSNISGDVSLNRLFSEQFLQAHSRFNNIRELLCAADIHTQFEFDAWIESSADTFISETTTFKTWDEFLKSSSAAFIKMKLQMLRNNTWVDEKFDCQDPVDNIHITLTIGIK